jgi:hypothetical protein
MRLVKVTAAYNAINLSRFEPKQSTRCATSSKGGTCVSYITSPTSIRARATSCTHNARTAIIVNTAVNVSNPKQLPDSGGCYNNKQSNRKGSPEREDKDFKPCQHVHGTRSTHLYNKCLQNPHNQKTYPVPMIYLNAFKKELLHLVKIGVLSPQGASIWASPTFITPPKDGRLHWVSDLQELNKVVKRKQYPLPTIGDILQRGKGYELFTKLDI